MFGKYLIHVIYVYWYLHSPLTNDGDDCQYLCSTYYIPGTILGGLQILKYFICKEPYEENTAVIFCIKEKTEAQCN